ncbi:MAG: Crp/Fnr family transcriptional regulator [bacterium]|nr:Crp/Fnr family transcriptional regulator [bacterium]
MNKHVDSQQEINSLMSFLATLDGKEGAYLNRYLSHAPRWVFESMKVVKKEAKSVFIDENAPVDRVYILVSGTVRAINYRIRGNAYDYIWFDPVWAFGAMEIFSDIPLYMTTLMTVTPCTMLVMTKVNFERWIWEDKNALRMEVQAMGSSLLDQNRRGRVFLFLQGRDRIIYMFIKNYEQFGHDGEYSTQVSRQDLAERSGMSVKTVNRAVKNMEEEGLIGRQGRKIIIREEHYLKMKAYLEPIINSL